MRIALLGCGTVGTEVARRLRPPLGPEAPNRKGVARPCDLVAVLVRRRDVARPVPEALVVHSIQEVLARRPHVAIEAMGGCEAPRAAVRELLEAGVHVVTANKSLLAQHGSALRQAGIAAGAGLRFEAAVGAAVPIVAALRQRRADRIRSIRGVLNGTSNAVLTAMEEEGVGLAEAIEDARRLGLCEPDPSADLSGRDSAEKLAVLAFAAGLGGVGRGSSVRRRVRGIEAITRADMERARRRDRVIRLVGELRVDVEGRISSLLVAPRALPRDDPLATARGPENVSVVDSDPGGPLILRGLGAGPAPTASALLGDVAAIAATLRVRERWRQAARDAIGGDPSREHTT